MAGVVAESSYGQTSGRVLRRLFLRLFLRGRPRTQQAWEQQRPAVRVVVMLLVYLLVGGVAAAAWKLGIFERATTLHAFTFLMVGMMLAGMSGTLLFNAEEADILLHRPVSARELLVAKVWVLVVAAFSLALALNVVGLLIGVFGRHGTWRFVPAQVAALALEVVFAASLVTLAYGLCLKKFGREKLDNLITIAQVLVAVLAMLGGQIVPRVLAEVDLASLSDAWFWLVVLPPAWFGGLTAVLAGAEITPLMGGLAVLAVGGTGLVSWLALGRLGTAYGEGMLALNEAGPRAARRASGQWLARLVAFPLVRWWVRDPVERAAFHLAAAGLTRARDVKLRIYPQLAQLAIYPLIFLAHPTRKTGDSGFELPSLAVALAGAVSATMVFNTVEMLRYSDHWRAAEIFRAAPLASPAPLFHGLRKAVLLLLCAPLGLALTLIIGCWKGVSDGVLLLLPGFLAMPLFAMLPGLGQMATPFAEPPEQAKNMATGCLRVALVMGSAALIAGLAVWADAGRWLGGLLIGEVIAVTFFVGLLRRSIDRRPWPEEA